MSSTLHFAPEEIMAHQDGELPAGRAGEISAHLNACEECRNVANSLRTTTQSLLVWKIEEAPATLQPRTKFLGSTHLAIFSWQRLRAHPLAATVTIALSLASLATVSSRFGAFRADQRASQSYVRRIQFEGQKSAGHSQGQSVDDAQVINPNDKNPALFVPRPGLTMPTPQSAVVPPPPPSAVNATREKSKEIAEQAPMIARTAELQIIVKKFEDARRAVQSIIARHQGYAANLNVGDTENTARILNASLRIPSQELPAALTELKLLGHVSNESQAGEEVTAQHADLVARLKNSRETETRLRDILRNRTGKVADVLEVEQEIARVRGEIEQMESERKSLEHRVDFATINLTITEEYKAKVSQTTPGAATQFHNAAIAGYENVTASALGLALRFTEYVPPILFWVVLLAAPAAFLWRLRRRALGADSPLA